MGLACPCGCDINTTGYPSPNSGVVIDWPTIDEKDGVVDLFKEGREYYECQSCKRLGIVIGQNGFVQWYRPE